MVLGIDPGLRNLGYCAMLNGRLVLAGLDDLFPGEEVSYAGTHHAIMEWVIAHKELLDAADVVVVEKQFMDAKVALSAALIVVMTVLQTVAYGKCRLVHAATIKTAYRTKRGGHAKNKEAATEKALGLEPALAAAFETVAGGESGVLCLTNKAADAIEMHHVADAYLLCHWVVHKGRPASGKTVNEPTIISDGKA